MNKYDLHIRSFDEIPDDSSFLDASERERYERFINPQKKREFLKGRVFIKQVLGEYLGISTHKLSLSISANGRPFLPIVYGENVPSFNLAHTRGFFALGISEFAKIGVDIELCRTLSVEELKLFLSKHEYEILGQLEENQSEKLLELFVQKEAFIKATDKRWGLDEISFSLEEDEWILKKPQQNVFFSLKKEKAYLTAVCLNNARQATF